MRPAGQLPVSHRLSDANVPILQTKALNCVSSQNGKSLTHPVPNECPQMKTGLSPENCNAHM